MKKHSRREMLSVMVGLTGASAFELALEELRIDPRFKVMLKRMNLPE